MDEAEDPERANRVALYTHLLLARQRAVQAANRRLTELAKEANTAGVSWAQVRRALRPLLQSQHTRQREAEASASIYVAIGAPVSVDLFEHYELNTPDTIADAEARGRFAAVRHDACAPPYPDLSCEARAWVEGWNGVMALVDAYNTRFAAREAEAFQAPADEKTGARP